MALKKTDKANLRSRYRIYLEGGMIVALLLLIAAFKWPATPDEPEQIVMEAQETVDLKEIKQTVQKKEPPPPPRPPVPVEVPNEVELDDEPLDLDATLDLDDPVEDTPPPPPPKPAQEEPRREIFDVVEQMPQLLPSESEGIQQLQGCVQYPEMARRAGIEGRVFVGFVVDENGNVTNAQVQRGIGGGTGEEAIRCVQQLKFVPGEQRGTPVRVKMTLPVTFRLN